MASINDYRDKGAGKKSQSSKAGLNQLMSSLHGKPLCEKVKPAEIDPLEKENAPVFITSNEQKEQNLKQKLFSERKKQESLTNDKVNMIAKTEISSKKNNKDHSSNNASLVNVIETKSSNKTHPVSFQNCSMKPIELHAILKKIQQLAASDINYLVCVLEMSNYGKLIDVHIRKEDFTNYGIPSGKLNDAKENCKEFVSWRMGRKPNSKSKAVPFFSLKPNL